jgi:hypothetical protein
MKLYEVEMSCALIAREGGNGGEGNNAHGMSVTKGNIARTP